MSESLSPQNVTPSCWYYEEPEGVIVVQWRNGQVVVAEPIPWSMLKVSIARHDRKKLPRRK